MNRLHSRPWFFAGLGTVCYLAGFNDALIGRIGEGWVELGRWVQTGIVVVILGLIAYLVADRVRERRSFHRAAVRAARATTTVSVGTSPSHEGSRS